MALLQQVLSPTFSADLTAWTQEVTTWEQNVERYSAMAGERLPDGVLIATLTKGAPGVVRQHLHLQATTIGNDYQKAKEVIDGVHPGEQGVDRNSSHSAEPGAQG